MLNVTAKAQHFLLEVIQKEKQSPDEELYLRLSMGMG